MCYVKGVVSGCFCSCSMLKIAAKMAQYASTHRPGLYVSSLARLINIVKKQCVAVNMLNRMGMAW